MDTQALPASHKVSVVIPSYNYARFLGRTIESLQAQSWSNWEAIIVDDGSTDDTESLAAALVASDSRIVYVRQANAGLPAARNTGLRHATGSYVLFLDADDLITPNKLSAHVEHFKNNPQVDISYSRFRYFADGCETQLFTKQDLSSDKEWMAFIDGGPDVTLPVFIRGNNMAVHAAMIRKSCVDKVGFFDVELRALEDWDYWLRCIVRGARLAFLDDSGVLALTRVHQASMTRTMRFSNYQRRVYENLRAEAQGLKVQGHEQLHALVENELKRQEKKMAKRFAKARQKDIQAQVIAAGFLNYYELLTISGRYGFLDCVKAYLSAFFRLFFKGR